jgi:putative transposase
VKYRLIQGNPEYPVAKWAEHLGIERTGYYAWLKRKGARAEREEKLKEMIREEFDKSRDSYGPDRISKRIRERDERIG